MIVELNKGHGLCMFVGISSIFVTMFGAFKVVGARIQYDIEYPTMYAPAGHKHEKPFNCMQRAHQNVLENYPQFLVLLTIASVKRPYIAAALGAVRLLGFIVYCRGYQSGEPQKRLRGMFGMGAMLGLLVLAVEVAGQIMLEN